MGPGILHTRPIETAGGPRGMHAPRACLPLIYVCDVGASSAHFAMCCICGGAGLKQRFLWQMDLRFKVFLANNRLESRRVYSGVHPQPDLELQFEHLHAHFHYISP